MSETDASGGTSDLQFVLQETRTILLQQILASDTGALSVTELTHRNPDLDEENVRYHLRELTERGIIKKQKIPVGSRVRTLPNTFFAVTETGAELLERAGLREEVDLWATMYDRMERTTEIEEIERLKSDADISAPSERDDASPPSAGGATVEFSGTDVPEVSLSEGTLEELMDAISDGPTFRPVRSEREAEPTGEDTHILVTDDSVVCTMDESVVRRTVSEPDGVSDATPEEG